MQHRSVSYTVGFAAAICVVCSLLVSSSATLLKERQKANEALDRQKKIYAVSNDIYNLKEVVVEDVTAFFETRVEKKTVTIESELGADKRDWEVFEVYDKDGLEGGRLDCLVIPVEGMGLWGTLYGYLAMESDGKTIRGLTFYKDKETPGLGHEVNNPRWKKKWRGRLAYNDAGEPVIRVIKGPAGSVADAPHEVDGLSGATITSNGVTNLLRRWLGEDGFGPYLAERSETGSDV